VDIDDAYVERTLLERGSLRLHDQPDGFVLTTVMIQPELVQPLVPGSDSESATPAALVRPTSAPVCTVLRTAMDRCMDLPPTKRERGRQDHGQQSD
jgi:hypothetical protein